MLHFIDEYFRITARAESPTSFLWWGAISCLSAVLRDNVWFSFPHLGTRVYPNTYILLIGESSNTRKSTPFNITRRLLKGETSVNNTKIIGGSTSIPGLLKILATSENGQPKGGSAIMIAPELSSFFVDDAQTIAHLTDLYDFKENYDKNLASVDIPIIKNLCLSWFAGTNEPMMQTMLTKTAKEGGLLARTIVIKETKRRHKDSGFEEDKEILDEATAYEPARIFLKKLAQVKGPAIFTPAARRRMNEWYHSWELEKHHTKTGFEGRLQAHILKLAIILSAAKPDFNCVIDLPELDQAIQICYSLLPVYAELTFATGEAKDARAYPKIMNILIKSKGYTMTRTSLMLQLLGEVDREMLDSAVDTMVQSEVVEKISQNGIPAYRLTKKYFDNVNRLRNQGSSGASAP